MSCTPSRVKITVGENKSFKIFLREEETGSPIDISTYTAGTVKFVNKAGVVISKALAIPGANPVNGELLVELAPLETLQFDKCMKDIQVEYEKVGEKKIVVLKDKLEVIEKIA